MRKKSDWSKVLKDVASGWADLAWPNLCLLCERKLNEQERLLCLHCLCGLPAIHDESFNENKASQLFYGKLPFVRVAAGFRYEKESHLQKAVELFKYKGEKELGSLLAKAAAERLQTKGFFEGIDAMVPVPLHPRKKRKRGYNQSEILANAIADITGIPVWTNLLERTHENSSQTTRNLWKRWENSKDLFRLSPGNLPTDRHLLLVDDVLTSGSTLEACGQALLGIRATRISFFALALA